MHACFFRHFLIVSYSHSRQKPERGGNLVSSHSQERRQSPPTRYPVPKEREREREKRKLGDSRVLIFVSCCVCVSHTDEEHPHREREKETLGKNHISWRNTQFLESQLWPVCWWAYLTTFSKELVKLISNDSTQKALASCLLRHRQCRTRHDVQCFLFSIRQQIRYNIKSIFYIYKIYIKSLISHFFSPFFKVFFLNFSMKGKRQEEQDEVIQNCIE